MSKSKGAAHRSRLCSFPIVPAGPAFPDGSFISPVLEPREQVEAEPAQKLAPAIAERLSLRNPIR
jgi:hypothetical protein